MPVRHADPDRDAAACAAIYAPYVSDSPVSFEEQPPSAAEMRERIARTTRTHPWLVLERDGAVAGYAYAGRHRERAAYRWSADVAVYVAADHHGSGAGRELMTALLDLLRRQRLRIACAGVALPNDASVALHRSLGFEDIGVERRIGWKAGGWRDVLWMQLELAPGDDSPPAEPLGPQRLRG